MPILGALAYYLTWIALTGLIAGIRSARCPEGGSQGEGCRRVLDAGFGDGLFVGVVFASCCFIALVIARRRWAGMRRGHTIVAAVAGCAGTVAMLAILKGLAQLVNAEIALTNVAAGIAYVAILLVIALLPTLWSFRWVHRRSIAVTKGSE